MNTLNSKTSEPNKFIYNFAYKLHLKNPNNIANLSIYYTWKNIISEYNNNKFKISLQFGMMNLICQMDHILFLTFKIILNVSSKNMKLLQIIFLYKFI